MRPVFGSTRVKKGPPTKTARSWAETVVAFSDMVFRFSRRWVNRSDMQMRPPGGDAVTQHGRQQFHDVGARTLAQSGDPSLKLEEGHDVPPVVRKIKSAQLVGAQLGLAESQRSLPAQNGTNVGPVVAIGHSRKGHLHGAGRPAGSLGQYLARPLDVGVVDMHRPDLVVIG